MDATSHSVDFCIIPSLGDAERRVRKTLWEEQEYFETLGSAGRLSWSPDGKLLAFSDRPSRDEHASSIFLLSLDSLEARRLTSAQGSRRALDPAFSPDGQILVCLTNCNFASHRACHNVTSPRWIFHFKRALNSGEAQEFRHAQLVDLLPAVAATGFSAGVAQRLAALPN